MAKKLPTFEDNQVPQHLRANRSVFTRWFGKAFLRFFGWRVEGSIANAERLLITAAPHTSNWDAVLGIAAVLGLNIRLHFLGKHTIFVPGLKWFMRWLGGIPVNRQNPEGVIDNVNQSTARINGRIDPNRPNDRVSGYTLGQLEHALPTPFGSWWRWRTRLRQMYNNPTDGAELDYLFREYR